MMPHRLSYNLSNLNKKNAKVRNLKQQHEHPQVIAQDMLMQIVHDLAQYMMYQPNLQQIRKELSSAETGRQ